MQGGDMLSVPVEEQSWPGASVNGQQHKPPSLEDQSYSGGEADAEQESSGSAGQRASLHRRSVSNSEVVDEQAWRSQDPGKRLQQLRTGKAAASRSATISPRNTFSSAPMGDELPAEEGSVAQPESDTADTRRKPSKRGFFRRKLTKPKEPELPAPPTLERARSATLKPGSRWGWMGLGPGGKPQAAEADGPDAAAVIVHGSSQAGGEQPSSQRQSFEDTDRSSAESADGQPERTGNKGATGDREAARAVDKKDKGSKAGHRRQSSLGSLSQLLTIMGRNKSADDEASVLVGEAVSSNPSPPHTPKSLAAARQDSALQQPTPAASSAAASVTAKVPPPIRPKTPELPQAAPAKLASSSSNIISCFGLGSTRQGGRSGVPSPEQSMAFGEDMEDMEEVFASNARPMLPPGMVGLRNLGNTCFMNAALQCLRFTPELPMLLIPDILDSLPPPGSPAAIAVATEHPPQSQLAADTLSTAPEAAPARPSSAGSSTARAPLGGGVVVDEGDATSVMLATSLSASPRGTSQSSPRSIYTLDSSSHHSPRRSEDAQLQPMASAPLPPSLTAKDTLPSPSAAASGTPPAAVLAVSSGPDTLGYQQNVAAQQVLQQSAQTLQAAPAPDCLGATGAEPSDQHSAPPSTSSIADHAGSTGSQTGDAADGAPAAQPQQQQQQQQQIVHTPLKAMAAAAKNRQLQRGEIAEAFRNFLRQVFLGTAGAVADPTMLLRCFSHVPLASEFFDGGQHDCQEVLRTLMNALHEDMNRARRKAWAASGSTVGVAAEPQKPAEERQSPPEQPKREKGRDPEETARAECAKADRLWAEYLAADDSPITDLFGGQLQSSVVCQKCNGRFTMYEPFWDLSLPLAKEKQAGSGIGGWLSNKTVPASICDCLAAFAADEVLQGGEAFSCEVCQERTTAVKRMRVHRLPRCLLLHIKRFRYNGLSREKLSATVTYPLKGLKLGPYLSEDAATAVAEDNAYNLYAVSNHFGNLVGGHYTTFCKANTDVPGRRQWLQLNDEAVLRIVAKDQIVSPNAYMLFYCRKGA